MTEGTKALIDTQLAGERVRLIVAESGFVYERFRPPYRTWEQTAAVTDTRRQVFKGNSEYQAEVLAYLTMRFPDAAVIHLDGQVQLPQVQLSPHPKPLEVMAEALKFARRELWRQVKKHILLALLLLSLSAPLILVMGPVMSTADGQKLVAQKTFFAGVALIVCGGYLTYRAMWWYWRYYKLKRVQRGLAERGALPMCELPGVLAMDDATKPREVVP
jgi:hypothetical protein